MRKQLGTDAAGASDAATKGYVDALAALKAPIASPTFSGQANFGNSPILGVVGTFAIDGSGPGGQQNGLYIADLGTTQGTTLNPTFTLGLMFQNGTSRSGGISVGSDGYMYGFRSHSSAGTYTWASKVKLADVATTVASSIALTGNPTAPTPALGDNDTSIATTAFVQSNALTTVPTSLGVFDLNNAVVGSQISVNGLESDATTNNWPTSGFSSGTAVWWNVITYGSSTRLTQLATYGFNAGNGKVFVRTKHDSTWYSWVQLITPKENNLGLAASFEVSREVKSTTLGLYTFSALGGSTSNKPTGLTYASVLNWSGAPGGSAQGMAQLAIGWTSGDQNWIGFRSLRDTTDSWWNWKRIFHDGYANINDPVMFATTEAANYSGRAHSAFSTDLHNGSLQAAASPGALVSGRGAMASLALQGNSYTTNGLAPEVAGLRSHGAKDVHGTAMVNGRVLIGVTGHGSDGVADYRNAGGMSIEAAETFSPTTSAGRFKVRLTKTGTLIPADLLTLDWSGGLKIVGNVGTASLSADGNTLGFTRPGWNYVSASDAAGVLVFRVGGTGTFRYETAGGAETQFEVGNQAGAVNRIAVQGGVAAGSGPQFLATGTDTDINIRVTPKGAGRSTVLNADLTGTAPTAPTAAPGTNTTQVATTAFVTAAVTAGGGGEPVITPGTTAQYWRGDKSWQDLAAAVRAVVLTGLSTATSTAIVAADTILVALGKLQAQITLRAPITSPTFLGTPAAPTATVGTNTTQLATTAFAIAEDANVQASASSYANSVAVHPRIHRKASATQALGNAGSGVVVQFPTAGDYANNLTWDNTLHQCKPLVAGLYLVTVTNLVLPNAAGTDFTMTIRKNTVEQARFYQRSIATSVNSGGTFCALVYCNGSTDYIDHMVFVTTPTANTAWANRHIEITRIST